MSVFCYVCGMRNEKKSGSCEGCNTALTEFFYEKQADFGFVTNPLFLNGLTLVGILSILTGFGFAFVPFRDYLVSKTVSHQQTALLALGLFLCGIILFTIGWIANLILNDQIINMYYDEKDKLSLFRILLIATKDKAVISMWVGAGISFIIGILYGLRPLRTYFATGGSGYPVSAMLAFGLEIIAVFLFVMGVLLHIVLKMQSGEKGK